MLFDVLAQLKVKNQQAVLKAFPPICP